MKALGAPIREFGFNRWWALFYGFGTLMFSTLTAVILFSKDMNDARWTAILMGALALLSGYMVAATTSSRASVHEAGISYKTLRSSGEMLWKEVEGYCYSVVKTYHQGIIPTTQYTIRLIDVSGTKAELGSNVQNPRELGDLLWRKLGPMLRDKMVANLEAHQPMQLGNLKLTHEGVEMKPPIGKTVFIPVERLAGCEVQNGMLRVFEDVNGKRKAHALMLNKVYNIFPLVEILQKKLRSTPAVPIRAAVAR